MTTRSTPATNQTAPTNQDASPTRRRLAPVAARIVVVLAVLVALDVALSWLLLPYGSLSEAIWYRYYQLADEPVDTLICGSSFAMQGIDPELIDETLGSYSCSLATPGQSRTSTLIALRDAYEDHHIKRAIVAVSIESMNKTETRLDYNLAFTCGETQGRSLPHAAGTYLRTLFDHQYASTTDSLALLAPWSVWHVDYTPAAALENLRLRRELTPAEAQAASTGHQNVTQRGWASARAKMSVTKIAQYACPAADSEYVLDERVLDEYRAICRYCTAHDIKLYFVTTPWYDYLLTRYEREGGYALAIKPFVDALTAEGATFLDCALFKPSFFHAPPIAFYNEQHLNEGGAMLFTPRLAEVIKRAEQGDDLSDCFFDHSLAGWQEYQASLEGILLSTFTATPVKGAIELQMKSWTAPDIEVAYSVRRIREDGTSEKLRGYRTDDTFTIPVEGHGTMTIRVNARRAGTRGRRERFCVRTILY